MLAGGQGGTCGADSAGGEWRWAVKRAVRRGGEGGWGREVGGERGRTSDSFEAEVRLIWQLNHRNLVALIGWCAEQGEEVLVYELVEGGDLHRALHGEAL